MTDSIKITTLTASIAAQSITVTKADGTSGALGMRDVSNVPLEVAQASCPLLAPRPSDFLTGLRVERDTQGADAALKTVYYTLHYICYYAPATQGITLFDKFDDMVTAAAVILNYFATHTNLSGATDILPQNVDAFGDVTDGKGTIFHGFVMSLEVTQFMET